MRTLVVPIDGSQNSIGAAHYAADMARAIDADLHILHVVSLIIMPEAAQAGYIFEDMEKAGSILLETLSNDLNRRTGGLVNVTTSLEIGNVELKIDFWTLPRATGIRGSKPVAAFCAW
jgi:nucleotide-binding universal stress UspA family protein